MQNCRFPCRRSGPTPRASTQKHVGHYTQRRSFHIPVASWNLAHQRLMLRHFEDRRSSVRPRPRSSCCILDQLQTSQEILYGLSWPHGSSCRDHVELALSLSWFRRRRMRRKYQHPTKITTAMMTILSINNRCHPWIPSMGIPPIQFDT